MLPHGEKPVKRVFREAYCVLCGCRLSSYRHPKDILCCACERENPQ